MLRVVRVAILTGVLLAVYFYPTLGETEVPFHVGEKLSYDIKLWRMKVGEMTSIVKEKVVINGHETYRIVVDIKSVGLAAKMYTLKDKLHIYLDTDTLELRKTERYLHEGNWQAYVNIDFDNTGSQALFSLRRGGKDGPITNSKLIKLPRQTLDATSLAYFIRATELDGRRTLNLNILYETEPKEVGVGLMPKEEVRLKGLGSFTTYVLRQLNHGDITLWLSDDERRLPVKIVAASIKIAGWKVIDLLAYLTGVENIYHSDGIETIITESAPQKYFETISYP